MTTQHTIHVFWLLCCVFGLCEWWHLCGTVQSACSRGLSKFQTAQSYFPQMSFHILPLAFPHLTNVCITLYGVLQWDDSFFYFASLPSPPFLFPLSSPSRMIRVRPVTKRAFLRTYLPLIQWKDKIYKTIFASETQLCPTVSILCRMWNAEFRPRII